MVPYQNYCNEQSPNPYNEANIISRTFFWWLNPFIRKGFVQPLGLKDLYKAPDEDISKDLGEKLKKNWDQELEKSQHDIPIGKKKPSLVRAFYKTFGFWYIMAGVWVAIGECIFRPLQAVALGWLIRSSNAYINLDPLLTSELARDQAYWQVFYNGLYLILFSIITLISVHPHVYCCQHTGMKLRISACHLVYRHALKLSNTALGQTTVGQMVNLLTNDVNRFDVALIYLHYLIVAPLQALIAVILLSSDYLGIYATLAGAGLFLLYVPFQTQMGRLFGSLRERTAIKTDERIRLMNEIIPAMRVIKMYCWEEPFAKLVDFARRNEVALIRRTSVLRGINMALFFVSSKLNVFLSLITYISLGYTLNPEIVFVTITLFNSVRLLMTLFFPYGVAQLAETLISCQRLQEFLLLPQQEDSLRLIRGPMDGQRVPNEEIKLISKEACANWTIIDKSEHLLGQSMTGAQSSGKQSSKMPLIPAKKSHIDQKGSLLELAQTRSAAKNLMTDRMAITALRNVTYEVKAGELMMIVGRVGSGKSSVLMSILGELPLVSGQITTQGLISYAAQEAWIFAGTVRENVLFGKKFDPARYERVLSVCALDKDIKLFPEGDETVVGERGVSLSGGQRARINLARAIYYNADIYLLDDPLSAVDTVVARHIFNECICKYLKDKVVVLATHQTQFVRKDTKVLFMQDGRQISCKNYTDNTELQIFIGSTWEKSDSESAMSASGLKRNVDSPFAKGVSGLARRSMSPAVGAAGDIKDRDSGSSDSRDSYQGLELEESEDEIKGEAPIKSTGESTASSSFDKTTDFSIYWYYIRASSSMVFVTILALTNVATQVLFNGCDFWLSLWTDTEQRKVDFGIFYTPQTVTDRLTLEQNAYIYSGFVATLFVLTLLRTTSFFIACTRSSINLHDRLFRSILRAPVKFFDINPIGSFLNRVSRDMGIVDDNLPPTAFDTIEILINLIGTLVVVAIILPILIIPAICLCTIVFVIRLYYLRTVRSIKNIEGSTRSPIFSHLNASLNGLTTIRAFRVEPQFEVKFDQYQDVHSSAWYLFIASSRWLGMTLDWISLGYIAVVTVVLSLSTDSITGSQLGLAISSALLISGSFQWGIRQSTEWESQMTSVSRIKEYSELPEESARVSSSHDERPPPEWPHEGSIDFRQVSLRYFDDKEPVLKDLNFSIRAGEKIGIVGRTGAGKSSIIAVLFRLTEPEGSIYIDGVETKSIGLHELRRKLSIIPQEPVLFNGTVRRNLDPFNEYLDSDMWRALEQVKLADLVRSLPGALDAELSEGGGNFSVGERQLICLARAVLRQNRIIILDEATANVDPNTDKFIQRTINDSFKGCTQLTIAHRLNTIMNSDRVLVMDAGRVCEFDSPYVLLQDTRGIFTTMVNNTGKNAAHLKKIAKKEHEKRLRKSQEPSTSTHKLDPSEEPKN